MDRTSVLIIVHRDNYNRKRHVTNVDKCVKMLALSDWTQIAVGSSCKKTNVDLSTRERHHRNLSVIYVAQNIFHQGKEMRNISLNAHYIVLFKSHTCIQTHIRTYILTILFQRASPNSINMLISMEGVYKNTYERDNYLQNYYDFTLILLFF